MTLPQVTLIALTGLGYKTEEHIQALKKSSEQIEFGAVKLIQLGEIKDIDSWNKAVVYELWKYVETTHAMLIHNDGYIIHPELWNPDWLKLDFIGAPWPLPKDNYSYRDYEGKIQRVGNSVSLRSKRLLGLPSELNLEWESFYGNTNEDGFFAIHNRHILEDIGCKFATFEQALIFGKEHELPENKDLKTFCFHSIL